MANYLAAMAMAPDIQRMASQGFAVGRVRGIETQRINAMNALMADPSSPSARNALLAIDPAGYADLVRAEALSQPQQVMPTANQRDFEAWQALPEGPEKDFYGQMLIGRTREPVDPLVRVYDASSPTGEAYKPRSQAAGLPAGAPPRAAAARSSEPRMGTSGGYPVVTTPQQWQSLPPGTAYRAPDGSVRVKK